MNADRAAINLLMDQASADDRNAFARLTAAVEGELFRLGLALGLSRDDAVEATQEALLRAYAARRQWRPGADALAWLCGIVVNVARECRRQRGRLPQQASSDGSDLIDVASSPAASDGDGWDPAALDRLTAAIDRLPPRQREAVACRYLRRMTIGETAQAMGCAEGTVKSAVAAALERLRRMLTLGCLEEGSEES